MPTTIKVSNELAGQLRTMAPSMDKAIKAVIRPVQEFKNIPFSKTIASLQEESEVWRIPFDGFVTQIIAHFPPGSSALVYTRLIYIPPDSGTYRYVIPSEEGQYLHLDDATPSYDLQKGYPVKANGTLRVEWLNYDGSFAHTLSWNVTIISAGGASPGD